MQSKAQSGKNGIASDGKRPIYGCLEDNLSHIRDVLGHSPDVTIRQFMVGGFKASVATVYIDGLIDKNMVNEFILHSLMQGTAEDNQDTISANTSVFDFIRARALAVGEIEVVTDWNGLILSILSGDTVILVDGCLQTLVCGTRGGEFRAITEPSSQVVIRGPKDGFTESIATNISLVRRRLRDPALRLDVIQKGTRTQTDVAIMYIEGVVDDRIIEEIKSRLNKLESDSILESNYIEELIEDKSSTLFPTILNTERPDSVAGNLLEGRVAIFVDGTPFVLIAPSSFFMFFQSSEDYYQRYIVTTVIRFLRQTAFLISLFVPSIYIAAITFHQEMIPTRLVISLATQRETVPFPAFIEALMMEVTFEILREAGIRMPRAIGQAVSIVGALVLGQAAVEAGIISSAMVIVVALTGISSFSTPAYNMALAIRLLRFGMMISAGILGFYGIAILSILILAHLCGLKTFGLPYMTPLAPFDLKRQQDSLFRFPFKRLLFERLRSASASEAPPPHDRNERGS